MAVASRVHEIVAGQSAEGRQELGVVTSTL